MTDPLVHEIRAVQASMATKGESYFSESELEGLRCVIRITMEFYHFAKNADASNDPAAANYMIDSIFSGVDSFVVVNDAHKGMTKVTSSTTYWDGITRASVTQQFLTVYETFRSESTFEKQCRLLLDLFRLQLIFAGMQYD